MSPTPVAVTLADRARLVQLGGDRRGGRRALRRPDRARSSGSTSTPRPHPPDARGRLLAAGRFETPPLRVPAVRLPAARRGGRGALRRRRPTRSLVGAGADEILDLVAKAFLPAGGAAVDPDADLRDVPGRHRAARARASSPSRGCGPDRGLGDRRRRPSAPRPRDGDARLAVQPEQPDRPARSRTARSSAARRASPADAAADGRPSPRSSSSTRRTPSSSGDVPAPAPRALPEPRRRPDREQGLRAGRPAGRVRGRRAARRIARIAPVPAAGLRRDDLASRSSTEALRDAGGPARPTSPASRRERDRLADGARARPAGASGRRSRTSCWSTSATAERAAAAALRAPAAGPRAADVRRRPSARRTRLRLTVRDRAENDRLIEAAREIAPTLPPIPARETTA